MTYLSIGDESAIPAEPRDPFDGVALSWDFELSGNRFLLDYRENLAAHAESILKDLEPARSPEMLVLTPARIGLLPAAKAHPERFASSQVQKWIEKSYAKLREGGRWNHLLPKRLK